MRLTAAAHVHCSKARFCIVSVSVPNRCFLPLWPGVSVPKVMDLKHIRPPPPPTHPHTHSQPGAVISRFRNQPIRQLRFRNQNSRFRNYDSETKMADSATTIQKPKQSDSETKWSDSGTK